jgi:aspartate 1-decarboxylase
MQLTFLKSKIHRAKVTKADLNYEGSISIDQDLLDEANLRPGEQVDVLDINNGERFTTYVIAAKRGSGDIQVNGAAARKTYEGDLVIICSYCILEEDEVDKFKPIVVSVDKNNKPT